MTEQKVPMRAIPAALVVARRAMVIAAASMVIAALAVVIALLGDPGSDPSESAALQQARDDAAAAQAESDAATAVANAATVIAEEAAAKAALAEEALVEALIEARAAADPEAIARLEAQLEEVRDLAATALVATEVSAADGEAAAGEAVDEAVEAVDGDSAAVEDATETEEEPAQEETPPSQDAAPTELPVPEPDDTATGAAADLPGEPFEFGPSAGVGLAVIGIVHESALNLRDAPSGEIIARLDNVMDGVRDPAVYVRQPDTDDILATVDLRRGIVATGNTRQLPTTVWHELRVAELLGWASSTYLAPLGADRDATGEVEEALGGTPTAETLIDLGRRVSALFESTGEVQSRTTVSSRPNVSEALGDITLDVIGLPDDSVRGYRINITADSGAEDWTQGDGGPFTLRSVTVTPICDSYRGVSDEGTCN